MSEEAPSEAPNWMKELEAKRERRLRSKLGHETGAGSPCLNCKNDCPGLDLHFWRKICKNCKCTKESHDVQDDDIYGFAQFQLLGSKPSKSNKIVLPGKKEELELDWAPRGQPDAVERYFKTLPAERLPIKGSAAARERKRLLVSQIPLHDIDPTLCDNLTEDEVKKMDEFVAEIRNNVVGIGNPVIVHPNLDRLNRNFRKFEITESNPRNLQNFKPNSEIDVRNEDMRPVVPMMQSKVMVGLTNVPPPYSKVPPPPLPTNSRLENLAFPESFYGFSEESPGLVEGFSDRLGNDINPDLSKYYTSPSETQFYISDDDQTAKIPISRLSNLTGSGRGYVTPLIPENSSDLLETQLEPSQINIGRIKDIEYYQPEETKTPEKYEKPFRNNPSTPKKFDITSNKTCHGCLKPFDEDSVAISIDRSDASYHSDCFRCRGCNQPLADLLYFYDSDSDSIYCLRDYAKIRGIPRCTACDELIFVKEYCLAENSTFHVKHFCCFECDRPLAGSEYVLEETQPVCLGCYERVRASTCVACSRPIGPDEAGAALGGLHFHADDRCFACCVCRRGLLSAKLLLRNSKLYCSVDCFGADQ